MDIETKLALLLLTCAQANLINAIELEESLRFQNLRKFRMKSIYLCALRVEFVERVREREREK